MTKERFVFTYDKTESVAQNRVTGFLCTLFNLDIYGVNPDHMWKREDADRFAKRYVPRALVELLTDKELELGV